MSNPNTHRWSGWPGAYCLYCGSEDPVENALALNWFDPITGEYDTPEHKREVEEALVCRSDDTTRRKVQQEMGWSPDATGTEGNTSVDTGETS